MLAGLVLTCRIVLLAMLALGLVRVFWIFCESVWSDEE